MQKPSEQLRDLLIMADEVKGSEGHYAAKLHPLVRRTFNELILSGHQLPNQADLLIMEIVKILDEMHDEVYRLKYPRDEKTPGNG